MKILFIQLPLNSHAHDYIPGNIEYAPALISSYLKKNFQDVQTETLPALLSGFASDRTILHYIKQTSPDIVSFSCYLWNIERHLYLADQIHSLFPDIRIICGGPEISQGSFAFQQERPSVQYFVSGEGEWFFLKYMKNESLSYCEESIHGNSVIIQPQNELLQIEQIIEPFASRELNVMPDGSIYLELTRGCPYRCSYCYYSKQCRIVRELPFDILLSALSSGRDIEEIYLLSPTFDASPDFLKRLEQLRDLRHGVSLHTELRAGRISSETAGLLYDAGFRSLEVGLQTLTPDSLDAVQRNSNPLKELDGIINLKEAGIDLKIGIIPGLPGEDVDSFKYTVDTLLSRDLGESMELYPLMILPGTAIRERADHEGISYLPQPPYFYLDGWGMSLEDTHYISSYVEEATGMSQSSFSLPGFSFEHDTGLTSACFIESKSMQIWQSQEILNSIETSLFSFHISDQKIKTVLKGLGVLIKKLPPHHLFNFIFYNDNLLNEEEFYNLIVEYDPNSFNRRLNLFLSENEGLSIRCFQVTENINNFVLFNKNYTLIEPILQVNITNIKKLVILMETEGDIPPLLIKKGLYPDVKEILCSYYREYPEFAAFESETDQQTWYNDISMNHVAFPFQFKSIKL